VPPELALLPRWFYINLYAMSAWTRTIVVPLALFYAFKPVRRLPPERGIRELFVRPPSTPLWPHPPTKRWLTWTNLFLLADQAFKLFEPLLGPVRRLAVKKTTRWLLEHFEDSDGVGAIFPPMIYTCVCLRCLGYADDSPEMTWALKQLDDLVIEEGDTVRLQPCFSPVWDTALTLNALADSGLSVTHPGVRLAVRWLLEHEVRRRGDWSLTNPNLPPGGWYFEYQNAPYPDTDDTAMVLMALARRGAQTLERATRPSAACAAAGHAEPRRRLGGVRSQYQPPAVDAGAVRRPQRHAGPELSGYHRAGARALAITAFVRTPQVCRAIVFLQDPERRRSVDRSLGRQLRLRHLAGVAGSGEHRAAAGRSDDARGRRG
jgi:squalene cyclase